MPVNNGSGGTGRGRSTMGASIVASAITLSAADLTHIKHIASAPLEKQLRGASPPHGGAAHDPYIEERKSRMKALDLERLRANVASGGADEEKVNALVKKLGEFLSNMRIKDSAVSVTCERR